MTTLRFFQVFVCLIASALSERDSLEIRSKSHQHGSGEHRAGHYHHAEVHSHSHQQHDRRTVAQDPTSDDILGELKKYVGSTHGDSELQKLVTKAERSGGEAHEAAKRWSSESREAKEKAEAAVEAEIRKAHNGVVQFHRDLAQKIASDPKPVLGEYLTEAEPTPDSPKPWDTPKVNLVSTEKGHSDIAESENTEKEDGLVHSTQDESDPDAPMSDDEIPPEKDLSDETLDSVDDEVSVPKDSEVAEVTDTPELDDVAPTYVDGNGDVDSNGDKDEEVEPTNARDRFSDDAPHDDELGRDSDLDTPPKTKEESLEQLQEYDQEDSNRDADVELDDDKIKSIAEKALQALLQEHSHEESEQAMAHKAFDEVEDVEDEGDDDIEDEEQK
eukprot:CAMPEP_0178425362 /NCGR_PEP_ID=MMETSP0689_2-20121128/28682_1 /TAXON_ID=160604 /ORGANISM="Amphidinium massartii, Strain CS-259" /LENGTH=386 /DNA_ID=CAMNT_0020047019 /DNA_START=67 /DNA_END=1227 /DNA_ORIENTATION=-